MGGGVGGQTPQLFLFTLRPFPRQSLYPNTQRPFLLPARSIAAPSHTKTQLSTSHPVSPRPAFAVVSVPSHSGRLWHCQPSFGKILEYLAVEIVSNQRNEIIATSEK